MLKVWLLVTAGVLQLVFSAPAALPDRLHPLYICLTPPSDRLAPPSVSLAPLMERLSRHLARGPAGPSDGQQPRFVSSIEEDGPGQQQRHLDQQQHQLSQRQLNMQQANQQLLGVDLTPQPGPQQLPVRHRGKREPVSSLSINNPLQVLRRRVMLELVRRRLQQQQTRMNENSELLHTIGKRSAEENRGRNRLSAAKFLKSRRALLNR